MPDVSGCLGLSIRAARLSEISRLIIVHFARIKPELSWVIGIYNNDFQRAALMQFGEEMPKAYLPHWKRS
jgi:hypothetical protein